MNNIKNDFAASEDVTDYKRNKQQIEKFKVFLKNLCEAQNINDINYNDDNTEGNLGVDGNFMLSKSTFLDMFFTYLEHNKIDFQDEFHQLLQHIEQNFKKIPPTTATQGFLNELFNGDDVFFEVHIDNTYPKFHPKSVKLDCSGINQVEQDMFEAYKKLQKIGGSMFYSIFQNWFEMEMSIKKDNEYLKKVKKEYELMSLFLRNNAYEQGVVINHVRQMLTV